MVTRATPIVVFGVLAVITVLVYAEQVAQHRKLIQRRTEDVAIQASRRLQILVDAGLAGAEVFARRWATHESRDFSRRRFHDFGEVLVAEVPGYHDVRLVAPGQSETWRARDSAPSAWEHLSRDTTAALIEAAREQRRTLLSSPVAVEPNQTRFFALLPLLRKQEFLGTLVVEFDSTRLMETGFHDRIRTEFNFEVSDGDHVLYANLPDGASSRDASLSAEQTFAVHNRRWLFWAGPREAMLAGVGAWANASILVFGLALSGAFAGLLHVILRRMKLYREARDRALSEILEREKAQRAVLASEARYRSVFDSAIEGLMVVDDEHRIVEANPVACQIHGRKSGDLNGLELLELVRPDHRHLVADMARRFDTSVGVRFDSVHRRADGTEFDVEVRASRFRLGTEHRVLVIVTDLTERQRTVQRLEHLSQKILLAQEEERARLSRELHDELGQLLTAAQLELGWLQKQSAKDEASLATATTGSMRMVEQAAEELRRICRGLRPPVLDDIGLEPAVVQLVGEFEGRGSHQVELKLNIDDDSPLPSGAALCVYRVLQESLNNISRHAQAHSVAITLDSQQDSALLVVTDDGIGFDPRDLRGSGGCGLEGMRERANLVNAELSLESAKGQGTTVTLRLPGMPGRPPCVN